MGQSGPELANDMGYSITWCAVREVAAEQLLSHIRATATGEIEEVPESPLSMAKLRTGWRLLWSNQCACPVLTKELVAFASRGHELLLCHVEEHVMASSAELWSDGSRQWWISHESEDGPKGLHTEGRLPKCFAAIRDEMERARRAAGGDEADVDHVFAIPLEVARALVGFKHDESCDAVVGDGFAVLARPRARKGLLARLLGR